MEFKIHVIPREIILKMVKQEQVIRYSKPIQKLYTKIYYELPGEKLNLEEEIQKYTLRINGFSDTLVSLHNYWKIPSTYWNDKEIKDNLFYMKLNIFDYPDIKTGDYMIDVELIQYNTDTLHKLSSFQNLNKPLIILAGSMT